MTSRVVTFGRKNQVHPITPRKKSATELDIEHPIIDKYGNTIFRYKRELYQEPEIYWIQRLSKDLPELKEYLHERRAVKFGNSIILVPHLPYGILLNPHGKTFQLWQNFYDSKDILLYNLKVSHPSGTKPYARWWMNQQEFNEWCAKTVDALNNCLSALGFTEFNVSNNFHSNTQKKK